MMVFFRNKWRIKMRTVDTGTFNRSVTGSIQTERRVFCSLQVTCSSSSPLAVTCFTSFFQLHTVALPLYFVFLPSRLLQSLCLFFSSTCYLEKPLLSPHFFPPLLGPSWSSKLGHVLRSAAKHSGDLNIHHTHTHTHRVSCGLHSVSTVAGLSQTPAMARCRSYLRGLAICVTVLLLVS